MDNIILYNETPCDNIDLDELYNKKLEAENRKIATFQKILTRIHKRIKFTAKQKNTPNMMFYYVPEFILGEPNYNIHTCVAYIIDKLELNGFKVRYAHPNTLLISWQHYVPTYIRDRIKRETGYVIDQFGRVQNGSNNETKKIENELQKAFENKKPNKSILKKKEEYKDVNSYKPTGIYNEEIMNLLKSKLN
jgi:hypothetical protein